LLKKDHLRKRLVATCTKGTGHEWAPDRFVYGVPAFADWRWGSLTAVLEKLLQLKSVLRLARNPRRFLRPDGPAMPGSSAEQLDETLSVPVLTATIRS